MRLLKILILTCLASFFIASTCLAESPYIAELQKGDLTKARELFWEDLRKSTQSLGGTAGQKLAFTIKRFSYFQLFNEAYKVGQYNFALEMSDEALDTERSEELRSFIFSERGELRSKIGDYENAMADHTKSFELATDQNNLRKMAWFLATCPDAAYRDGEKAVEYAKQAQTIEQEEEVSLGTLETLAAAYAETGDFQEAITIQENVISVIKEKYPDAKEALDESERYLTSYKSGKAWRMKPSKTPAKQTEKAPQKVEAEKKTEFKTLTKEQIRQLQKQLAEWGYQPGPADGLWGKKTGMALKKFQSDQELEVSGKVDEMTWQKLEL